MLLTLPNESLEDMADLELPAFSKSQITDCGKALRGHISANASERQRAIEIFEIANNWRAAHLIPMRHIRAELLGKCTKVKVSSLTAARLKRMTSIRAKLRRAPHTLYQMQDIGGVRAILPTMADVRSVRDLVREQSVHIFKSENDYCDAPKSDGYRGIHIVQRYHGRGQFVGLNNSPMLIETQLRTQLQHAWATAVEAVGLILREDLKSGEGDRRWLRFFALISAEFAEREGEAAVPGVPFDQQERQRELRAINEELNALGSLENVRSAVNAVTGVRARQSTAYIVSFNPDSQEVKIVPVAAGSAKTMYREAENSSGINSVLVEVDRAECLRAAYPNYFLDVTKFVEAARLSIKKTNHPSRIEGLLRFLSR